MNHENVLAPKIVEDENEGTHAVVHMKDMSQLLDCIYQGEIFWDEEREEEWTYGKHVVGRENLKRALIMGKTSDSIVAKYHTIRGEIERKAGISKFVGQGLSCKRRRVIRDDGDDLSMSRLMGGSDQYWTTTERNSQRANIRIGMNFGISSGHDESSFARLGATLGVITDILTKMGYSVEVIAFDFVKYSGKNGWDYFGLSIPMKIPNEPLDVHRIMTSGLPGLFRDFCFGLMKNQYKFATGLGQQCETTDAYKQELDLIHVVEHKFCKSTDDAVDGLSEMMKKLADKPHWFRG